MSTENSKKKDTAIVAVTAGGVALGRRLKDRLPGHLYLPEKLAAGAGTGEQTYRQPVKEVVRELFHSYRSLVLIMATGIAVRLIATELKDKRRDPGVVVVDESGSFSISLLSGHVGGANKLAARVASLIGAEYPAWRQKHQRP